MGRVRAAANAVDPATGRPLSPGVGYRGSGQYRARKLIDGKQTAKTFETDKLAREWLEETAAKVRAGQFVDRRASDKSTLAELVQRYVTDEMQDGGRRRGAAEDRDGHVPATKNDAIGALKLSKLTAAEVRGFKKRQETLGFVAGTVVKRLNLLAGIISHATTEWDMPFARNPASGREGKRPPDADVKRDRRVLPPPAAEVRAALATGERPPRHEEDRLLEAIAKSGFPDDLAVTKTANFLVNRRMNKAQQMRWSRRGANLLLQVRCAIHNGTLGSGFGQKFHPANDTHSQAAVAARPPILRQSPTHNVKLPRRRRPAS